MAKASGPLPGPVLPRLKGRSTGCGVAVWSDGVNRLSWLLLGLVLLRAFYFTRQAWAFSTDDAYITLRYARHLASGHGIVWNVGEAPVEGYSNFPLVLLGAGAIVFGLDPILCIKLLCVLAFVLTLIGGYLLARLWVDPLLATVPALVLSSYVGTIWWTVSGLETALYQFLLLLAFGFWVHVVVRTERTRLDGGRRRVLEQASPCWFLLVSGLLAGLAGLMRPEGPIIGVVIGLAHVFHRVFPVVRRGDSRIVPAGLFRPLLGELTWLLGGFLVIYLPYQSWHIGYFGRLLPNSVHCKADYRGDPWTLIRDFVVVWWPALLLSSFGWLRRRDAPATGMVLSWVLYLVLLYGVNPIIGKYNRHFLGVLPLVLVSAVSGFQQSVDLLRRSKWRLFATRAAVALAYGLALFSQPATIFWLDSEATRYAARMRNRAALGHWLDEHLEPNESFVLGDAGIVPFIVHARAIDAYCLNSLELTTTMRRDPKAFASWVMDGRTEVIVVPSVRGDELQLREKAIYPAILREPRFASDYRLERVFGQGKFNYWVFARRDREE